MSIIDNLKKSVKRAPKATTTEKKAKKTDAPKEEMSADAKKATGGNEYSFRLLRSPHVSEKAARLTEQGTYVFQVPLNAEKVSVKKAVEALYKVNVVGVRMIRKTGKPVNRAKHLVFRKATKKALVTVKKGQSINMYEGV